MDVDHKHTPSSGQKCYNCGHLARTCLHPSTQRAIHAVETQPAECDLAREMREMREELRKLKEENAELRKRCEDF
jgi:hypothetical protein